MENLFNSLPDNRTIEHFESLFEGRQCRVERIVSFGQSSPESGWYDQDENEWVLVLSGYGLIEMETGERYRLGEGDYLLIKAGQKHRVVETAQNEPTIWLAIFYQY
ncbi:cupin [Microbulbifer sp. A4B17]|uniref:cupin domain-containing protein n=1 Tax=Microbulbifer sp. A4B17 TaxID=359370 RepID=UPI000D52EBD3|nr:cupin domain-containing protein [Microbulbifer sp. A4B17]AWF82857.1 cupin [Microbulbifer sp. A4B17]